MKTFVTIIFVLISSQAVAGNYTDEVNKFFKLYEMGKKSEAVDSIYSTNPWMTSAADAIVQIKSQFQNIENLVGNYNNKVLVDETNIKDRFVHLTYLALYDRQPVRMEFQFYKPKKDWIIYSFSFDVDFDDDIENETRKKIARGNNES